MAPPSVVVLQFGHPAETEPQELQLPQLGAGWQHRDARRTTKRRLGLQQDTCSQHGAGAAAAQQGAGAGSQQGAGAGSQQVGSGAQQLAARRARSLASKPPLQSRSRTVPQHRDAFNLATRPPPQADCPPHLLRKPIA
ncbi:MAG: hypothetical protein D6753_04530 [Planctomycetota bacterium]|nr:MAG: hypothetical protein D6753_04530 [Planctomycetota bacterium]